VKIKNVDKIVIEITKQEIIDEIIYNFKEFTSEKNNDLDIILKESFYLYHSLKNIHEGEYQKIFEENGSLKCLPEEVFNQVENYFFSDEDDEEIDFDNIVSFKKGSKEIKPSELEIAIKDGDAIVAKISEDEIQY
jgi:hypothetical protein